MIPIIKMDGVAFAATFVHSFEKEKEFVDHCQEQFYQNKDPKVRRALLRDVYRIGKKMKEENGDSK